jgi:hypothetical protein
VKTSELPERPLHGKLCPREVITIAEVCTLLTVLPSFQINIQLAVPVAWSRASDTYLKNLARQWLPELEMLQVGIDGAKATLHVLPLSCIQFSGGA